MLPKYPSVGHRSGQGSGRSSQTYSHSPYSFRAVSDDSQQPGSPAPLGSHPVSPLAESGSANASVEGSVKAASRPIQVGGDSNGSRAEEPRSPLDTSGSAPVNVHTRYRHTPYSQGLSRGAAATGSASSSFRGAHSYSGAPQRAFPTSPTGSAAPNTPVAASGLEDATAGDAMPAYPRMSTDRGGGSASGQHGAQTAGAWGPQSAPARNYVANYVSNPTNAGTPTYASPPGQQGGYGQQQPRLQRYNSTGFFSNPSGGGHLPRAGSDHLGSPPLPPNVGANGVGGGNAPTYAPSGFTMPQPAGPSSGPNSPLPPGRAQSHGHGSHPTSPLGSRRGPNSGYQSPNSASYRAGTSEAGTAGANYPAHAPQHQQQQFFGSGSGSLAFHSSFLASSFGGAGTATEHQSPAASGFYGPESVSRGGATSQSGSPQSTFGMHGGLGGTGVDATAAEETSSSSARSYSSASSVRDDLPLCTNDDACPLINDRKHQRKFAHTCRLFPCYHGHIARHAKLFRHAPGQIAQPEGVNTTKLSTHALTSVNFSTISPEAPNAYRIYVSHGEKSYEIFGDWATVKVHTFKRYLHQVYHIAPYSQVLIVSKTGKNMDDDISTVKSYGVEDDAVVQLKNDTEMEGSPRVPIEDL